MSLSNSQLGDMMVVGEHEPRVMNALAVIAAYLHPSYDEIPDRVLFAGNSKKSCLFSALTVRNFLVAIGFTDATVAPCSLYMRADLVLPDRETKMIHSLGIGVPGDKDVPNKFNGHAVTIVPSLNLLIDTTLYQTIRPQWNGAITGQLAIDLQQSEHFVDGRKQLAGTRMTSEQHPIEFQIAWVERLDINWRKQDDFRDLQSQRRRRAIVGKLRKAFGN